MIRFFNIFLGSSFLFITFSCSKKNSDVLLPELYQSKIKDKVLAQKLDSIYLTKPKTFSSKFKVDYKGNTSELNFRTSIKIKIDTSLSALVTKASIPILQALITRDSLKLMDKQNKCYMNQSINYFNEILDLDLNYSMIEEVILGVPFSNEFNQKYYVDRETYENIVTNTRKASYLYLPPDTLQKSKLMLNYSLNQNLTSLSTTKFFRPSDTTEIQIQYLTYELINGKNIPSNIEISLNSPQRKVLINITYDKTEIDQLLELIFIIPENYEVCN